MYKIKYINQVEQEQESQLQKSPLCYFELLKIPHVIFINKRPLYAIFLAHTPINGEFLLAKTLLNAKKIES